MINHLKLLWITWSIVYRLLLIRSVLLISKNTKQYRYRIDNISHHYKKSVQQTLHDTFQPKTLFLKFHIITLGSPQTMENCESLIKHQCNALDLPSSFLPLTNAMEDLQHGILDFSRDCSLHCHVKIERVRERDERLKWQRE